MNTEFFFAKVKAVNTEGRTIDAVASTADIDRDNERLLPSAFAETLGSFKANPVILATHQHRLDSGSSPVIGSALPESIKIGENEMTFTMQFATTALGEEYWSLYRDGHMKAFSVGFIPLEWKDEKDEQLGYIRTLTKVELLEISAVPVPSNRRALARAKGFYDDGEMKAIVEAAKATIEEETKKIMEKIEIVESGIEKALDDIRILLTSDRDEFAKELLGGSDDLTSSAGERDAERIITNAVKILKTKVKET
jgi:HK97 family phage prohead protease